MNLRTRLSIIVAIIAALIMGGAATAYAVDLGGVKYVSVSQRHTVTVSEVGYLRQQGWTCWKVTSINYVCTFPTGDAKIVPASATRQATISEIAYLTQHGWKCQQATRLVYQCRK